MKRSFFNSIFAFVTMLALTFSAVGTVTAYAAPLFPTVVSSIRADANPTWAATVNFTVTFSEAVTGVDATDFYVEQLGAGNLAGISIASVTPVSSSVYTVTANTGTGSGRLKLKVRDNNTIKNGTLDLLGGPLMGDGQYFGGEDYSVRTLTTINAFLSSNIVYAYDFPLGAPVTLWINGSNIATTAAVLDGTDPLGLRTVAFFAAVGTLAAGDNVAADDGIPSHYRMMTVADLGITSVNVTTNVITGTAGAGVNSVVVRTAPPSSVVTVTPAAGVWTANMTSVHDILVGESGGAAVFTDVSGNRTSVPWDSIAPTVVSGVLASPNPTLPATAVDFTITFSEAVTGVDAADFVTYVPTGSPTGTSVTGVVGSGTTYTVTVNTGSGAGTLRLIVRDNDTIKDNMGNPLNGVGNTPYYVGGVYTIDVVLPTIVSIVGKSVDPTNAATVTFDATFSKAVTNVDAADFSLAQTGVTGASIATVTSMSSGYVHRVVVNTGTGDGTLGLDLINAPTITDLAGNTLVAGGLVGPTYSIDKTAPTVVSSVRADANPVLNATGPATLNFTVTFTENVTGVGVADFVTFAPSGSPAGASVTAVTPVSGTVYTVTVNRGAGVGNLRLIVRDDDTIRDSANNALGGAGAGNGVLYGGAYYTIQ